MNLGFSEEEERWKQEVRDFLNIELPAERMRERAALEIGSEEARQFGLEFNRKMARKGWLVGGWPKEYGGQEWSFAKQFIFNEEISYYGAPRGDVIGKLIAGPAIMSHGTEEQKRQHLPAIAKCEKSWCQGFSEPDAGSDLASLRTGAIETQGGFILNGQKVWTTLASRADWGVFLARTDPQAPKKYLGITYFLLDMKTHGVIVRPLAAMGLGNHHVHEVFLDNVFVPESCVLGGLDKKNQAWTQIVGTLDLERSGISGVASARRMLEELVSWARENDREGKRLAQDSLVRQKLAEMAIEIEVARLLSLRIMWMQSQGIRITSESSQAKLFSSELSQRLTNVGMELLGLFGQLERGDKWAVMQGRIENAFLVAVSNTIGGGTSEIMRNTIAIRGLGLPREPRKP